LGSEKNMFANARIALLGLLSAGLACSSLRADFLTISQPTAAYLSNTTLLDFTDLDGTITGGLSDGKETLIYSSSLIEYTVPGTWTNWDAPPAVESSTPRVGFTNGASSLVINLSAPARTFGLEIEPDNFARELTTAAFYSGSTLVGTINLSPDGNGGALLFAASTTRNPFTNIVINNVADDDFAIAEQRFAAATAPEPATIGLIGPMLLAGFVLRRRSRPR
jgi:hypothetical protein